MKNGKGNAYQQLIGLVSPYFKSMLDVKNASLLGLLFFLIWQVGYDSCLKPNLEKLTALDSMIKTAEKQHVAQKSREHLFKDLQKEISNLPVALPSVTANQSKSLVAVTLSEGLLKLAKGDNRVALLPTRPAEAVVQVVKLTSEGKPVDTTIGEFISGQKPSESTAVAPQLPPAAGPPTGAPPSGSPSAGPAAHPGPPASGAASPSMTPPDPPLPTAESVRKLDDKAIPLVRYDYQLLAHGTYAGFADLINQLTLFPKLIAIRNLSVKPVEGQPPGFLALTLDVSFLMSAE